ncbi:MAG: hypothetical protein M3P15_05085 [Actinomycetota bacterium]|nr:hypothetical protein [Actinomycetota bacterium]
MARETVGRRLKRLREERGLSQRELSEPGVRYVNIASAVRASQAIPSCEWCGRNARAST